MNKIKTFFKNADKKIIIRAGIAILIVALAILVATFAIDSKKHPTVKDNNNNDYVDDGTSEIRPNPSQE